MTSHKWKKDRDGAESCERVGCTVRKFGKKWQPKPRARWRLIVFHDPVPPCAGKEAAGELRPVPGFPMPPVAVLACIEEKRTNPDPSNRRDADLPPHALDTMADRLGAMPAPSPLEVVREKVFQWLEVGHDGLPSLKESATAALATLEESIRKDEREKCARIVDTVATGYGSLQRQALGAAARELRNRK